MPKIESLENGELAVGYFEEDDSYDLWADIQQTNDAQLAEREKALPPKEKVEYLRRCTRYGQLVCKIAALEESSDTQIVANHRLHLAIVTRWEIRALCFGLASVAICLVLSVAFGLGLVAALTAFFVAMVADEKDYRAEVARFKLNDAQARKELETELAAIGLAHHLKQIQTAVRENDIDTLHRVRNAKLDILDQLEVSLSPRYSADWIQTKLI